MSYHFVCGRLLTVFLLSCFTAATSIAKSPDLLSGTVTDGPGGQPVPGVVIRLENSYSATITDQQGGFKFEKLAGGTVTLHASHIAFVETTMTVTVPTFGLTIALQPKSYLSDEVVITATRAGTHSGFAYTEVTKHDLDKVNLGQDLPLLLQLQPSVTTTSDAGNGVGYTGIRIRGSDGTRVNVTINGIPVNDAESHMVYWVDLPDVAASAEDIQIQRGVGTSTNGAGAFGGSINLRTGKLQPDAFGEISSSYGSFTTNRNSVRFGTGLLNNKFELNGRISAINSDGYVDRASANLRSYYLSGGYYGKKQSLRAVVMSGTEHTYAAWYGVTEDQLKSKTDRTFNWAGYYTDTLGNAHYYDNQTDNYQQDYFQLIYSRELASSWILNLAAHYTKGIGYYEEYIDESYYYGVPLIKLPDSSTIIPSHVQQRWLDNDFYGATWSVNHSTEAVELNIGGAANHYTGEHFGKYVWQNYPVTNPVDQRYYDNTSDKKDANVYAKATWKLHRSLYLMGDAQLRHIDYSFYGLDPAGAETPEQVQFTFFNPKAGITYEPNTWHKWYASVSVGQKEPVRSDYRQPDAVNAPEPEKLIDYEGGYRYSGHTFTAGVNLYYMDYSSQLVPNGRQNADYENERESVGDSYRAGCELEAGWAPNTEWLFQANLTASQNKIEAYSHYSYDAASQSTLLVTYQHTKMAYSPDLIWAGTLNWKPVKPFTLSISSKYVGEQFLDNTTDNSHKLESYIVQDLRVEWSPAVKGLKRLSFKAAVYNFLDQQYSNNGYIYYGTNWYFPQAGRNFMAGVTVGL